MWFMKIPYFLRRALFNEHIQNIPHYRVADARSKLSVREGSCSTFSKLNIRRCIKLSLTPKCFYRKLTGIHISAAFQHKRSTSCFSQKKCRKHTRRAKPDNNGTSCRNPYSSCTFKHRRNIIRCLRNIFVSSVPLQKLPVSLLRIYVNNIYKGNRSTPVAPCIDCLTYYAQACKIRHVGMKTACCSLHKLRIVIQRNGKV